MHTRRDFLKTATMLSGAAGILGTLPPSIQKAMAINPANGSTYLDAEHVVILMQENRSFDHAYGSLQGVRGFNDPRAITLPTNHPVWLQTNAQGQTYAPFRLNIKETKATWIGSLPHSWTNQVDAQNKGKHDQWLEAKVSGNKAFAHVPLTMGYYNREDIPFYYSLADAFTVCDQNFCSSLTGTTPNRLYLFTGTIRESHDANTHAKVRNEDVDFDKEVAWKTFPERLQENDIPWKIYQNEISLISGFTDEEDSWLGNFTDNPIEWFAQFNVRHSKGFSEYLAKMAETLPGEIKSLKEKLSLASLSKEVLDETKKELDKKQLLLDEVIKDKARWNEETFNKLSNTEQELHTKAFTTNRNDPSFRKLKTVDYDDAGTKRTVDIPEGDLLHQFRNDVEKGELPMVSWIVAPENFSDHPGAPWYGAWYVSEVMDILTHNPEVWKKTIFILCYDENDGYFDHVPPFVSPDTRFPETGKVSKGLDTANEHVTLEQDLKRKPENEARGNSIGLGFRVPLVIASPWSRGGAVNSQVFDHTSIIQFMEKFLTHKTGKKIEEKNITDWRRTVCGDLSSVFTPYHGEKIKMPEFVVKDTFIEGVHKAQFKKDPFGYHPLDEKEIRQVNESIHSNGLIPAQEKGVRISNALPYQLYVDGKLNTTTNKFEINFQSSNEVFGAATAGSPFNVYGYPNGNLRTWAYAVLPGDKISDEWSLEDFNNSEYYLKVYGPNGFYRHFKGNAHDPRLDIAVEYAREPINKKKLTGNVQLKLVNHDHSKPVTIVVKDNAYKTGDKKKKLTISGTAGDKADFTIDLTTSFGWYDFTISIAGNGSFEKRYAGKVETGKPGFTDPAMGNI